MVNVYMCLPVGRELKLCTPHPFGLVRDLVYMCLPVWRELKHIIFTNSSSVKSGLHVPSRWEGIETPKISMPNTAAYKSTCAFLFGGN